MRYRIAWRHSDSAEVILGHVTFPSFEAANEVADVMNDSWPETEHWAVCLEGFAIGQDEDELVAELSFKATA